jgi:hypothetical protein
LRWKYRPSHMIWCTVELVRGVLNFTKAESWIGKDARTTFDNETGGSCSVSPLLLPKLITSFNLDLPALSLNNNQLGFPFPPA